MGDGSPGSREAEGEGGEDFYITLNSKHADLLLPLGQGGKNVKVRHKNLKRSKLAARAYKDGLKKSSTAPPTNMD